MTRTIQLALLCALLISSCRTTVPMAEGEPIRPLFISGGSLRLGVDLGAGGSLFHLSQAPDHRNLVNHHDRGRFIQQSYYGDPDRSFWRGNFPRVAAAIAVIAVSTGAVDLFHHTP